MHILLLHQNFLEDNDAGGSRYTEMTRMWHEKGHKITVLASMVHYTDSKKRPEFKGKFFVCKQQGPIKVWRCHTSQSSNKNFFGRLLGYFSFMFFAIWAGLFKAKEKYDIILVTSPPLFVGISAYVISRFKHIPYVFEVRDLWPESAIDTGVLKNKYIIKLSYWVEKVIYKKAKLITVLTPAFKKTLIEKKNIKSEKILYIPNAADFSLAEQAAYRFDVLAFRKQMQWENKFVITYVGAHGVANHLEQVLDAALLLKDTKLLFVLIGNGMSKPGLIEAAKKQNIINVMFIDAVPKNDIFKYILASDMGASILKKVDTFKTVYSNKTFDYLSCKKPVLMAIDGISRELIENAGGGLYVEPENAEAYNTVIRFCLNNPDKLKEMGEKGYAYIKQNFDRELLASDYINKIENCLAIK